MNEDEVSMLQALALPRTAILAYVDEHIEAFGETIDAIEAYRKAAADLSRDIRQMTKRHGEQVNPSVVKLWTEIGTKADADTELAKSVLDRIRSDKRKMEDSRGRIR